ncbi:peptidoglycan -binding protein [Paracoccus sp. DMF-8]|uniref:peptidoglycan -binding protein n=1 Tax=Paracoccus sp. DMF-8 TaxID=3019445 RepID=UPI0023E793B2|nr:peptidoglycan -binding protein [Paracoccus sp. DMF-8]MDF3606051.1 peptidoglycan -binding protein [Paracoccus sp. DMF-8]
MRPGRGARFSSNIWPGYVDAVTTLLMVIMFALTIAMVVQAVLRERIDDQDTELTQLGDQIAQISLALSSTRDRASALDRDLAAERARSEAAERDIAAARSEIDAWTEAARLDAARREALEELVANLRRTGAESASRLSQTELRLTETEAARLADAAAAAALREKLEGSTAELDAMTLQLEAARKEAEETLTLLAAADAAKQDLQAQVDRQLSDAEKQAALLALAERNLASQSEKSGEEQRRIAALSQQVEALSAQLGSLQAVLNIADEDQKTAELQVQNLGQQLNAALLRAAEEERRRVDLEREAREKAEAEAADLGRYRSEFFGRLSRILEGRQGVQVVGDRFVFSSEVLFSTGEALLSDAGREQIRNVTGMLEQISAEMPTDIDWIIRVDGHTDSQPLSGQGRYRDNWELSQARALAVVRYMVDDLGFPANRVAATGFADTRPVATGDTDEDRAMNRRIELKLTER